MTFLLRKEANAAIYSKRTRAAREGFAVAPILYLLAMAGVAAGVLFSGYSQILRTNINITNATTAKGDLTGGASTLAATSVFTSDQSVFCPPGGPDMSADCVAASAKVKMLSFAAAEAARRPTDYDQAGNSGSPTEVGVFAAGSGVKQLDPWGRYYIYCRWEQDRNNTDQPAVAIISAGANGTLETECGAERAGGDDQFFRYNVGAAINRASVWQQAEGATEANFGANITVTGDGVIEAKGLILSDTATITGTLNLTTPLPVTSGGTGASTQSGARTNLGATSIGGDVFTATTTGAALTALGGTAMGQYLFTGAALIADTASAVRSTLLGAGEIGDALFLAATATEGRATLGSTTMGDYLFTASALDGPMASTVRSTLLGASAIGNSVFTAATTELALTGLGASDIGKALFIATTTPNARLTLGAGETGSSLFTAGTQLQAWEILGLTGTLNPTLDVGITGEAGSVDAENITGGAVPIAHGGTSATNASAALDNLFGADGSPTSTLNMGRIAPHSIGSGKLDDIVAAGTYNLVEVDSAGRVVAGSYIGYSSDEIGDGVGDSVVVTATGGGYVYFSTASAIRMTLSPLGYLGLGITQPEELLHLYGGDARISGAAETTRELQFATGTDGKRWIIAANDAEESGSSAGSNFIINRVTDAGAEVNALTINRASGNALFGGQVAATGGFLGVFTGTFSGTITGSTLLGVSATETSPYRNGDLTTGLFSPAAGSVAISNAGTEALRVTATGSVGIGTSSPAQLLDVNGIAAVRTSMAIGAASVAEGSVLDLSGATGTAYSSMLLPKDTSANRPTTGAVGMIRYNTTTNSFEGFQGAVPAWASLAGSSTFISGIYLGPSTAATNPSREGEVNTGLFSPATGVVAVSSLGAEALRVTATGSVGIGTSAPAQKLDVSGNVNLAANTNAYYLGGNKFAHMPAGDTTSLGVGILSLAAQVGANGYNTGIGFGVLSAATATGNTAIGAAAMASTTTGTYNTALGQQALYTNTTGSLNTAIGYLALMLSQTAGNNTAIGAGALGTTTTGGGNTVVGSAAAAANTGGELNTAVGMSALAVNQTGNQNAAFGAYVLGGATGAGNTGVGTGALMSVTSGAQNTALGWSVGSTTLTTGTGNILIGNSSAVTTPAAGTNNFLNIGNVINSDMANERVGLNMGTTLPSYPLQVGTTTTDGSGAYVTTSGVWTNASDRRIKENIRTSPYGTETLMKLKPVAYDMIGTHEKQIGFIAQEVAEVVPEVVSISREGRYGLSYGNLLTVAVKALQEMVAANDNRDKQIAALVEENRKLREAIAEQGKASGIQRSAFGGGQASSDEDLRATQKTLSMVIYIGGGLLLVTLGGLALCGVGLWRLRRRAR